MFKDLSKLELDQKVLRYIREHTLFSPGDKVLVAVSGGPDSVCMLYVLVSLKNELNLKLHVAHLNHKLRGADSDADAAYVARLCRRLKIPANIEERDVKAYKTEHKISLEEAAREVRYAFLAEVAKAVGARSLAVGHTTDDHIETILMHLIRGSGTRGLQGLQPLSCWHNLTVIRPLLPVSRGETAEYCREKRLSPRLDASNLSLSLLRNRIRLKLIPMLRSYNPGIVEALLRTARIAADDISYIEDEAEKVWEDVARKEKGAVILDREKFLELPSSLKRQVLRISMEKLLGSLKDIEMRHIEDMLAASAKPAGKSLDLPGGLTFSVEYDRYVLSHKLSALIPLPSLKGEYRLNIPGETSLPGWRVEATLITPKMVKKDAEGYKAYFDFAKTGSELTVRSLRPGDRFQPLGMSQTKKLGEFMLDAKIPRSWRQRVPIVCSPEQIIWAVGWRIDERVKVTESARRVLRLRFYQSA